MRILVFSTDDFLPPAGGAETAIGEIARRHPHHAFTLICGRLDRRRVRQETVGNVTICRIGIGHRGVDAFLLTLCGSFVALRMHRQQRFDLIWAVLASYGAGAATMFHWFTRVPFLLTLQEGNNIERGARNAPGLKQIYQVGFRAANGLHAISRYLLDWGIRMGFRAGRPAELIPNGIDQALFMKQISSEVIAAERFRYHVPPDAFVITTVSRLVPKNGIGDLIQALTFLPPRFILVIHGFGPLQASLEDMARALDITERVRFMGPLAREHMPVALRAANAFARPSLTEGLGTAFLEAMAAGVPVIATPVGGIVDFLRDGETGFFTTPHNPKTLAHTIERVAALSDTECAALVECARTMVFREYDWDDIARRMDALFHRVAQRT